MTVHSLVLFENGRYTEIAKEFDLSVHNSHTHPETNNLVEDNYMTFLLPNDFDKNIVYDYIHHHDFHLMESWELSVVEKREIDESTPHRQGFFDSFDKPDFLEHYKMYRIHYWTDRPTHWVLNPEVDLFVFNSDDIKSMVLYN